MPIRFKQYGGGWVGPVGNGNLRVRWGAASWISPAYVYRKMGDPGGGYWYDTGYRGRPNPPQSLQIYGWDFSNVSLTWAAPAAGGGPVTSYELLQTDAGGNGIQHVTGIGGAPWGNFAVGQDGRYRFWVRAKGVGNQYSDWVEGPPIGDGRYWSRAQIGHTETGYYQNEGRTRGWASGAVGGARVRGEGWACWAPNSNFVFQSMHWRNLRTPQGWPMPNSNGFGFQSVVWVANGVIQEYLPAYFGTMASGHSYDWWVSNGITMSSWFGLMPVGGGFSTDWGADPQGLLMLYTDSVWVQGYENYTVSVYYMTRAYAGNNYW